MSRGINAETLVGRRVGREFENDQHAEQRIHPDEFALVLGTCRGDRSSVDAGGVGDGFGVWIDVVWRHALTASREPTLCPVGPDSWGDMVLDPVNRRWVLEFAAGYFASAVVLAAWSFMPNIGPPVVDEEPLEFSATLNVVFIASRIDS